MTNAHRRGIMGTLVLAMLPLTALAQPADSEASTQSNDADNQRVIEARLSGDQTAEYRVAAQQGQILSVDLDASRDSVYFNIKSADGGEFLFAGMMSGNVADVALPESGDYLVQVFLVRAAARRDEQASYTLTIDVGERSDVETNDAPPGAATANDPPASETEMGTAEPTEADRAAQEGPAYWQVELEDAATGLNVRSGPGQQHAIVGQLTDGEALENLGCRLSGDDRWCHVRAANSGLRGWVAGRLLVEGSAPSVSGSSKGDTEWQGLTDSDHDFDATGTVACVLDSGQPAQACPFGVIRDGPGNAGIWIAMPSGQESNDSLHILFETGMVTAINNGGDGGDRRNSGADYVARKIDGHYQIVTGMRQFVIPETIVYGQKAAAGDATVDDGADDDDGVDGGAVDSDAVDDDAVDDAAVEDRAGDDYAVEDPQGGD